MKTFIPVLAIFCLFFASCSKGSSTPDPVPPPPPPIPDTLTTGWSKTGTGIPAAAQVSDVYFTSGTGGFATTDQGIFKSTDGGINWSFFNAVNNGINIGGFGNRYCFVGSDNRIHYTNDGTDFFSKTYLLANPASPTLGFRDCFVASPAVLYASSVRYIYKSTNGGVQFDSVYVFPDNTTNYAIYFTSVTEGWLMRSDGLYKTTNGGTGWALVASMGAGYGSIDFLNSSTGLFSDGMHVYKTTNGGANWSLIFSAPVQGYVDVEILSANDIYLSAANKIYKSVNGGTSFTQVLSSAANGIVEIHFTDSNTGWACGGNGAVYRYKP
jgi:photosystem II stability/assembly factor-like uncharacterized protein